MRGDYGTAQVIGKEDVTQDLVLKADQVLVGTNRTRKRYNQRLRELKGFSANYPQAGDKLVCLRNDPAKGLLNGSLWKVMTSSRETVKPGINLLVSPEEDDPDRGVAKIKLLKAAFDDPDADIPWQQKKRFDDFDYGYALTVHKAQGSQWNDIVLFDESFAFKETRQRWLYTAITRAAETADRRSAKPILHGHDLEQHCRGVVADLEARVDDRRSDPRSARSAATPSSAISARRPWPCR